MLFVVVLLALLVAIAAPALARMRANAAVQNGRYAVVSTLSLARATAMRFGRPAILRLDSANERVWVEIDTTVAGEGAIVDTLGLFDLSSELHLDMESNRDALCFDGRGIATTGTECPETGGEIALVRQNQTDTLLITSVGRVKP